MSQHYSQVKEIHYCPLKGAASISLGVAGIDQHGIFTRSGSAQEQIVRDRGFAYLDLETASLKSPGSNCATSPSYQATYGVRNFVIGNRRMACEVLSSEEDQLRLGQLMGGATVALVRALTEQSAALDYNKYGDACPAFVKHGVISIISQSALDDLRFYGAQIDPTSVDLLKLLKPNLVLHIPERGTHWEHTVERIQIGGKDGPVLKIVEPISYHHLENGSLAQKTMHSALVKSSSQNPDLRKANLGGRAIAGVFARVETLGEMSIKCGDRVQVLK